MMKQAYELGVACAVGVLFKTANFGANQLIGQTMKAVRRAMAAGNVDKAHEIARLGIRSKTIEPVMLQRLSTPSAGITQHEAKLWSLAGRPTKPPVPQPAATSSLVDPQMAKRWSEVKQQKGWT
jgi:hypothetical protein